MPFGTPQKPSSGSSKPKKKGGGHNPFGGIAHALTHNPVTMETGRLGSDLGNIARHIPGGLYEAGKGVVAPAYTDIRYGPNSPQSQRARHTLEDIGQAQWQGIKDLGSGDAWAKHPGMNLLTLLAVAAPVAKVAGIGKLADAGGIRTLEHTPTSVAEAERFQKAMGTVSRPTRVRVQVPTSRSPLTAVAQKGTDRLRAKSTRLQGNKVAKELDRNMEVYNRRLNTPSPGVKDAVQILKHRSQVKAALKKIPKTPANKQTITDLEAMLADFPKGPVALARSGASPTKVASRALSESNALLRAGKLYRFGYVPPNLLGANFANLIHMGHDYPMEMLRQKSMVAKGLVSRDKIESQMGGGISEAGMADYASHGPVAHITSSVGRSLGKATDRASRERAFLHEARKAGYDTPDKLNKLLDPNTPHARDLIMITRRAEDSALNFTHPARVARDTKFQNKLAAAARRNVFLARWLETSTRYGGHVVNEFPTKAGLIANQTRNAPDISQFVGLKKVPQWFESYIPAGHRGKLPVVRNAQGASLFDSPGDIVNALGGFRKGKGITGHIASGIGALSEHLNPVQQGTFDLATGYNKYAPDYKNSSKYRVKQAEKDLFENPYTKLAGFFPSKTFPRSETDLLKNFLLGGTFAPTPVVPARLDQMVKGDRSKPRGHRHRRHKHDKGL